MKSLVLLLLFLVVQTSLEARLFKKKTKESNEETSIIGQGFSLEMHRKPVTLPEGAELLKNISYDPKDLGNKEQAIDVYFPAKKDRKPKSPVIIMVHGGAWMMGDKGYYPVVQNKINHWLPKGFVFISVNYEMSFNPNPLNQVDNLYKALQFIQNKSQEWMLDTNQVILMGHSAGAHLVSLLTSNPEFIKNDPKIKWKGVIALDSAAFDLPMIMNKKHYRFYDRVFGSDKEFWIKNSPYHQLKSKIGPMLIVCSSKRKDACPQAENFQEKALNFQSNVVILKKDLSHGEINLELGLDQSYTKEIDDFISKL